jgi:protease IV
MTPTPDPGSPGASPAPVDPADPGSPDNRRVEPPLLSAADAVPSPVSGRGAGAGWGQPGAASYPPSASAAGVTTTGSRHLDDLTHRLANDYLSERRASRRWSIFFRLLWLLVVVAIATALFSQRRVVSSPSGPHTALVEVRGPIAVDTEASAENLVGALKQAFEDASAKGVVLRINSPGGSPVQSGIVYDEIVRLKALHQKRVYAVVEESAASGAYYIAAAADEIYADKASVVGSIGVLMDSFGFTGTLEKLGIERRLMTAGANKGIGDPFSPMSPTQKAHLQTTLDQIHQQFIDVVKEGRGDKLKDDPDLFSGLFWNGQQAVDLGLVDELGNLDYVAREVIKAPEIIDYTARENIAERLAKRFGASIGAGAVKALHGLGQLR